MSAVRRLSPPSSHTAQRVADRLLPRQCPPPSRRRERQRQRRGRDTSTWAECAGAGRAIQQAAVRGLPVAARLEESVCARRSRPIGGERGCVAQYSGGGGGRAVSRVAGRDSDDKQALAVAEQSRGGAAWTQTTPRRRWRHAALTCPQPKPLSRTRLAAQSRAGIIAVVVVIVSPAREREREGQLRSQS